jgi:hypothetical protein
MTDAIRALRLAVEAGGSILNALPEDYAPHWQKMCDAHWGSLDAALALMKAVLPGRGWSVHQAARHDRFFACVNKGRDGGIVSEFGAGAMADTPARALLIAVLKALEATAPASQSPAHLGDQEDSQ